MNWHETSDRHGTFDFDQDGPRIGPIRLMRKSAIGFQPRRADELTKLLSEHFDQPTDAARLEAAMTDIARAMNAGDLSLAAIATSRLSLTELLKELNSPSSPPPDLRKASVDDPKHPGYPAGDPDGKGGQFRPKDNSAAAAQHRSEKAARLAQRRSIRATLRRVLTSKRLLRLLGENAAAALTEAIPGLDAVVTASTIADDLALLRDLANDLADTDAAVELAEKGPVDLEDLKVSGEGLGFNSFSEFKKGDLDKQFGPAGEGVDYHHLVEQGPNVGVIPDAKLQSTDNIVKIPRLMHEDVNSFYATPRFYGNELKTPRSALKGQSFEDQKAFGIDVLRKLGAVK